MGTPPPLIGRSNLLADVDSRLDTAADRGGSILILGGAGVGKSAILACAAVGAAHRGYRVLRMTGLESETGLPFAGLHQLLHGTLDTVEALPPQQREAIASAFGAGSGSTPSVFLIGLAVLGVLGVLAEDGPVVLLADDVQWLDPSTVEVLSFIARRLDADPVVIFMAARAGHDTPLLQASLETIDLDPLGEVDARRLLDEASPGLSPEVRRRILREAAGNPLALLELPKAVARAGSALPAALPLSERLELSFAGRQSDLPTDARAALLVAALDDRPSVAEVLAATAELLGRPVAIDILTPGIEGGLVRVDTTTIEFRHPLIRSAVIGRATLPERHGAHLALARALTANPDRALWHRSEATVGTDDVVADALDEAVTRARDRGAMRGVLLGLERAAALTSDTRRRAQRLVGAAEAAFELGLTPVLRRIIDEVETLELSEVQQARVGWFREQWSDRDVQDPDAINRLLESAHRMSELGETDLAFDLVGAAALRCWWSAPAPAERGRIVAAAEHLDPLDRDPRVVQLIGLTLPVDGESRVRAGVDARLASGDLSAVEARMLGATCHTVGDFERARHLLERSEPDLRRQARLGLLVEVLTVRAWDEIHLGRFDEAERDAQEAFRLADETDQPMWRLGARIGIGVVAGVRGDRTFAMATFRDAESILVTLGVDDLLAVVQLGRGLAALTAGRPNEAYAALDRVFDPADSAWHELESYAAVGIWADAAIQTGQREAALATLQRIEAIGRRTGAPILHVGLRHARAVFADDDGSHQDFSKPPLTARTDGHSNRHGADWLLAHGCADSAGPSSPGSRSG